MKFINDRQRKAVFASMRNKFAAKSETGESLRPVIRSGNKEQSFQDYLDNNDDEVKGYTGSGFDVYPIITSGAGVSRSIGPSVLTESGSFVIPENTVILAGKDYKADQGPRTLIRLRKIKDKLADEETKKQYIRGLATIERDYGKPVYSHTNEYARSHTSGMYDTSEKSDRELAKNVFRDIKRLKDVEDVSGVEEVPHLFEDRHHLENLEIDEAMKPIEDEVGRHRKVWEKIPETKSYEQKYPYIHPRGVSLGEYVDEGPPDIIYLSKHPKAIGSSWEGEDYKHGPRIMQPSKFAFIRTVEPDEKYRKFVGGNKIPDKLPKGAKLVVGKLKGGNKWGVQSILTPKD